VRQPIPFGKYLLLERISVGGMAEVFKAKAFGVEGFEKIIAIKRILPTMAEDLEFIQMFIDEAKIAGQLSHANICQIFELGKITESHFIAMEFIWGKDLLQMQNRFRKLRQTMPVPMAAFIAAKMCEGLDYAHRKKDARGNPLSIVHRDVSPQNILVSYEGEVKLIDFGIAKAATRSSKTQAGVLKGKFGYMSPEQVRGLPVDRRADVFAVGTILYELLTAERLFLGESDFSTLEKVRNVDISPPSHHNRNIPAALERIVMRALSKDADDRYQWASEMQEDLLGFLMSLGPVYTAKQLAAWMKDAFGGELARERQLLEHYKKVGRDGIILGKAAAEVKVRVEDGLGAPPPPEDGAESTALGGPSFDDLVDEAATKPATPAPSPPPNEARGRVSRGSTHGFGEEAPTEIFGEVESKLTDEPAPLTAEATVILPGGSTAQPQVPPPPPVPPGGQAIRRSGAGAAVPGSGASGSVPAIGPPPAASLGPQGPPSAFPAPPDLPPLAPLPGAFGAGSPPPGVAALGMGSIPGGRPGDFSNLTAAVPRLAPPSPHKSTLVRDVAIGVGVAVLVVGLLVGGRTLFFKPAAQAASPKPTGTIVVATVDGLPADVFVNGAHRAALTGAEPLTLDQLEGGEYEVAVKRAGVPACVQRVVLDVRRPEVVNCRFAPPAPVAGRLVLRVATEGATVLVDNQEISAAATSEPILLAPEVEHQITVQREGFVSQSLQVVLKDGETLERAVELVPVEPSGRDGERSGKGDKSERPGRSGDKSGGDKSGGDKSGGDKSGGDKSGGGKASGDRLAVKPLVERGPTDKAPGDRGPGDKDTGDKGPGAKDTGDKGPGDKGAAARADVGYLIANTTPYAKVLIDDKDTGKMTPIAPRAKLALTPGKHVVTFVHGAKRFSYPIIIEAGKDHRLIKTLPVE
jgi:tRNA A-37 threonylcarbamoyl transferase component Bud32/uncharacterized membrane protein YgcG